MLNESGDDEDCSIYSELNDEEAEEDDSENGSIESEGENDEKTHQKTTLTRRNISKLNGKRARDGDKLLSGDKSDSSSLENENEESVTDDDEEISEFESEMDENDDDDDEKQAEFDKYDSSDEEDLRNTIGNIPVAWYNDYPHIGYDWEGKKMAKKAGKKSEIDDFLSKMDDPNYWKTVRDKQTGEDVVLPEDALATVSNVMGGRYPKVGYNPYQTFMDLYSHEVMIHPVTNRPEHKRSFIPSKLEKKQVSKIVHAIKMGWLKPQKPKSVDDAQSEVFYDLWASEAKDPLTKSQMSRLKMHIPAPKMKLPGHVESYNPPPEYLFTKDEEDKWKEQEAEERKTDFVPSKYDSLRKVPGYTNYIHDRFSRCVDLYLAPRQRKMRLNVDPNDLLPKLPKPQDLHPFPTTMSLIYKGHKSLVRCLSIEPRGQYFASGGDDNTIRIWEVHSGRCVRVFNVDGVIHSLAWTPNDKLCLLLAAINNQVYFVNVGVGDRLIVSDTDLMLKSLCSTNAAAFENEGAVKWKKCEGKMHDDGFRVCMVHRKDVKQITWHVKGDYFATVCPEGGNSSVFVHQLSKTKSQTPFTKSKGIIQKVLFHPTRPYFFVATQRHVRVYNLLKQQLTRKLMTTCKLISSIALHPKGDNLIIGSYDSRLNWFDLDLSAKPYKTFRQHNGAVRSVCFHPHYPLFASASDDGTVIVSHGMVYNDLLQNPLIVPVKILRGHGVNGGFGVLDCLFHPMQPWLLSCGSDFNIRLYV